MKAFCILVVLGLNLSWPTEIQAQNPNPAEGMTTYFFIRHAEKDTSDKKEKDPELTSLGLQRVQKWTEVFAEIPFDHIYSTNYKRTQQTAAPIAKAHNLPVQQYDPRQLNNETFQEATQGKTVLIVGHSNTNPRFVNALLGERRYQDLEDTESGSLFMVSISPTGEKSCQLLYLN